MSHILGNLSKALVDEMQKGLDMGHKAEVLVDHFHKEVGVQKDLLKQKLAMMIPTVGSEGHKAMLAAEKLAKDAAAKVVPK